jgi:transcriptional regulator with XRE-family HTH domain
LAVRPQAVRLATRLRDLRRSHASKLTQADLAHAFGVSVAAISSWESATSPKLPPAERLNSYALFFSRPSLDDGPHLPVESELTAAERTGFQKLQEELIGLRKAAQFAPGSLGADSIWRFENGPVTIICPDIPVEYRSALADEANPNYTRTASYADVDALIELWGHIRSLNPDLQVVHRLSAEVKPEQLRGHIVVLGGTVWNEVTDELQKALKDLPIRQIEVPNLKNGEIFELNGPGGTKFGPRWEARKNDTRTAIDPKRLTAEQIEDAWRGGKPHQLIEDVAFLARLENPYKKQGTITICSGIYSRGVMAAVRVLSDPDLREQNEAYIASRFPRRFFAMLMKVPVVNGDLMVPDLELPGIRLYEWAPNDAALTADSGPTD